MSAAKFNIFFIISFAEVGNLLVGAAANSSDWLQSPDLAIDSSTNSYSSSVRTDDPKWWKVLLTSVNFIWNMVYYSHPSGRSADFF